MIHDIEHSQSTHKVNQKLFENTHPTIHTETFLTTPVKQWQQILAAVMEPITVDSVPNRILIEGLNIPKSYLLNEIAQKIIDPKTNRLRSMPGLPNQHKVAFASFERNGRTFNLYFKENPIAPGREYLAQQLYLDLIGHGCAMSELVQFTINNINYPVLIIESQIGQSLHDILQNGKELPLIDAKSKSQLYLASIFEMQEDGKAEHYFTYPALSNGKKHCQTLCKIDIDHAFLPSVVSIKGKIKLQQKVILYTMKDWLDESMHPDVIEEWLAMDKITLFNNLLIKLINRDNFYYELFGLHQSEIINQFYSHNKAILIESMLPANLINEWIQLSERINKLFEETQQNQKSLTHKKFLSNIIPLTFKFYQIGLHKYPYQPLQAFKYISRDGYIFSTLGRMHTKINGRDLLLSSLKFVPTVEDIQQRTVSSIALLNRLDELQEKNKLLINTKQELIKMNANLLFELPTDWCEQVMDLLIENEFPNLEAKQQKFIIESLCKVPIQRLRIEHTKVLDYKFLKESLKQLPYLLHLRIVDCPNLTQSKFNNLYKMIAKFAPFLETLELQDIPANKSMTIARYLCRVPFYNYFKKFIVKLIYTPQKFF